MIPASLMDEVMTIFTTRNREEHDHLRADLEDVLNPWWAAMTAMILIVAEEGLPDAQAFEL